MEGGAKVTLLIHDLPCTIPVSILLNTSNVKHTIHNEKTLEVNVWESVKLF